MQKQSVYISEVALMPLTWFLKQSLFRLFKLESFRFTYDYPDKVINLILFPLSVILLPLLAFLRMQHYEDLAMKDPNIFIKEFTSYGNQEVKTYRNNEGKLDVMDIFKKAFN